MVKWTVWTWIIKWQALLKEVIPRNDKDWTNLSVDTAISCMPTLQICSAQPDNQIVYVTNDNVTDASNQDYSSYESSAYPSSYRSSSSYELYDASSGSQSLGVSEYASGFDDYGSSYGSAEDGFQINFSNLYSWQFKRVVLVLSRTYSICIYKKTWPRNHRDPTWFWICVVDVSKT